MRSKFGLNWTNGELAIETYLLFETPNSTAEFRRELSLWVTSRAACVSSRSTSLWTKERCSISKKVRIKRALCKGFQPLAACVPLTKNVIIWDLLQR
ncbi:hypothetical protein T02_3528 [Trichinella nativa]|uniref:Uncharacterized protein n=1 Tax=Trichinella nativa TaxID=6335 RepID=A0A0V1KK11_9BILA|nr:hypothetical protein T02_3528 [Trichinella nativa]